MKKNLIFIVLCTIFLVVTGCEKEYSVKAPVSELTIQPSSDNVNDSCYNITPEYISKNSDYSIFKFKNSAASFLMYKGEVYELGTSFGGYGVVSMALADLNKDKNYELYFTFSWGSGIHQSQIGYFDPSTKEITIFNYTNLDYDMILTTNEKGELCVNETVFESDSFVDYTIKAGKYLGRIIWDDEIKLDIVGGEVGEETDMLSEYNSNLLGCSFLSGFEFNENNSHGVYAIAFYEDIFSDNGDIGNVCVLRELNKNNYDNVTVNINNEFAETISKVNSSLKFEFSPNEEAASYYWVDETGILENGMQYKSGCVKLFWQNGKMISEKLDFGESAELIKSP